LRPYIAVVLRLATPGVVVMMVCAGKPGCGMLTRGMFARNRMVGMHGVRMCSAMIGQSGAVALHRSAARTGCRGVTAQAATTAVATSASTTHVSAATTSATAAATGVSAAAARGDA
jgi:hypothetical protein